MTMIDRENVARDFIFTVRERGANHRQFRLTSVRPYLERFGLQVLLIFLSLTFTSFKMSVTDLFDT